MVRAMTAYVEGREASISEATGHAARILAAAQSPLIFGLGTDVEGAQAAMALAQRIGAVVDHASSVGLIRQMRLLRETGGMVTTPGEARNRPDLIMILGKEPIAHDPDLLGRLFPKGEGLPRPGDGPRRLLLVGAGAVTPPGALKSRTTIVEASRDELPALVGLIGAGLLDRRVAPLKPKTAKACAEAIERLEAAKFTLVVFSPDELDVPVQHGVLELVRTLNGDARASTLPVGGAGNAVGVNQVCAWTSGLPLRTSFAQVKPAHDPWIYDGKRLLASGEADALVWIDALGGTPPKTRRGLPVVAISARGQADPAKAQVMIEVGVPAKDHSAALYSGELGAIGWTEVTGRDGPEPSVAGVIHELLSALGQGEGPRAC